MLIQEEVSVLQDCMLPILKRYIGKENTTDTILNLDSDLNSAYIKKREEVYVPKVTWQIFSGEEISDKINKLTLAFFELMPTTENIGIISA